MTSRRAVALGAALLFAASSAQAAIVVKTWKPVGAVRYLTQCVADALVDLPTCASPNEGFICTVTAEGAPYTCLSGSWDVIAGAGGGDSFKTINAPAGTDPVADSATDTLNVTCSGGLTCTGDSTTDTLDLVMGSVATATALASNPADCSPNQFANVIAANGDLTCAAIADADVPNNITVDLATAATSATSATTAATANAGDSATAFFSSGTLEDAYVDGSLEADEVNPTLGSQTQGDYVSGVTANQGLLLTGTEGATLGLIDCAASEALVRNAGDTAWECASVGGGSGLTHPQVMARLAVSGGY